jgi:diguanylate cyclase (GGDEF)-like protein/PAS domain S-box-containing protein
MHKTNWLSLILSVLFLILTAGFTYLVWSKGLDSASFILLIFPLFFIMFFKPSRLYMALTAIVMLASTITIYYRHPENIDEQLVFTLMIGLLTMVTNEVIFRAHRVRKQVERRLRASEERYSRASQAANGGIWDWDLMKNEIYLSPEWKAFLGYGDEEISNQPDAWLNLIHPDDLEDFNREREAHLLGKISQVSHEHRIRNQKGEYVWVLCRGAATKDKQNQPVRITGSQIDITDRKKTEEKLAFQATHDLLTGLFNRSALMEKISDQINQSINREPIYAALLMIDLDGFKEVNDRHGHAAGDKVLKLLAERLESCIRKWDDAARLGGDEFAFLMTNLHSTGKQEATLIAGRILKMIENPFEVNGRKVKISASIGIAMFDSQYTTADAWFHAADTALYHAKAKGKARLEFFSLPNPAKA